MPKVLQVSHYWFFGYGPEINERIVDEMGLEVFQSFKAFLRDYRLVFSCPSPLRPKVGTPDLVASSGCAVEGMLYEIDDEGLSVFCADRCLVVSVFFSGTQALEFHGSLTLICIYLADPEESACRIEKPPGARSERGIQRRIYHPINNPHFFSGKTGKQFCRCAFGIVSEDVSQIHVCHTIRS